MAGEWLKAAIGGEGLSLAAQKGKIVRHRAGPRLPRIWSVVSVEMSESGGTDPYKPR